MTSIVRARKVLEPGIAEILKEMGPKVKALEWRVGPDPSGGGPAEPFDQLWGWAERGEWVEGRALVEVVNQDLEVFKGEFFARRPGEQAAAVALRASHTAGWEVEAADASLVARLRVAFPGAVALPKGGFRIPPGSLNARAEKQRARALAREERARKPRRDNLDELLDPRPAANEEE